MAHCNSYEAFSRRQFLQSAAAVGLGGGALSWLTPVAQALAQDAEKQPSGKAAKSVIVLWMQGGPSQFETFNPHPKPDSAIAGGTKPIKTAAKGIEIAAGLPLLAEEMASLSLVRTVTSKEGDHERATYNVKTGFRPDPTLVHPALGAIICHQLPGELEIPRHVSILPGQWPARGGFLGDQFDAFKTFDPRSPVPDVKARVDDDRFERRLADLDVVEAQLARRRPLDLDAKRAIHRQSIAAARKMMTSEQLKAFDVSAASQSLRDAFGDTQFGRGCLAAVQLIEAGVRCVEVTQGGWDTHANNHQFCETQNQTLDPAFASLLKELKARKLLDSTIVLWAGEFGRTPQINGVGGRDHWPHGFTVALGGGGIAGGRVIGETNPEPKLDEKDRLQDLSEPHPVEDIHATVLHALGIDFAQELETPVGRPMALSKGTPIAALLA